MPTGQDFLRLYGDWLVGFNDVPCFVACDLTADSVRPNFNPMTRVGVFDFARLDKFFLSPADQAFPLFRFDFDITAPPDPIMPTSSDSTHEPAQHGHPDQRTPDPDQLRLTSAPAS